MPAATRKKPPKTLATKIVRYASASYALGKLCATESRAEIVMINVGSGGFNINQVNGGLSVGQARTVNSFPTSGGGLSLLNQFSGSTGLKGEGNLYFATTGNTASIIKLTTGNTINAGITTGWTTNYSWSAFNPSNTFSTNNYVAFRFGSGGDISPSYNYGWLQTTWDGTNFQINSGAYESTVNTAILAGASVPEPGTLTLGSLALLAGGGAAVRRYRKQRQEQSATTNDATNPVTPVA
ncbi:MAG: PEP-CTERM sorting domain-containing protein [Gemmataceae bacterium]